jgi:hypothetical protein
VALLAALWVGPVHAAEVTNPPASHAPAAAVPPPAGAESAAPTIGVVTFGPGDAAFAKFGHDAILVVDPSQPPSRRQLVFNYGTFSFSSPWLAVDFLEGQLNYWLSVSSLDRTLAAYKATNRSVYVQLLALPPDTARAVAAFLHENAKPENASYRYDYYRDNCATRVRDVIDRFVGHRLAAISHAPTPLTYREHTERLTVGDPILYFALDLAMGPLIDRPLTEWDAMFLPEQVEAKVAQLTTEQGDPLVKRRVVLFEAKRDPELSQAPGFRWGWLSIGIGIGALLYVLSRVPGTGARGAQSVLLGLFGTLTGVLGTLLLILWLFTDHQVTYWNQNVLLCPAWALAVPWFAFDFGRAAPRRPRLMMLLVGASSATALLALLLRLLVPHNQDTSTTLALFLPLWLGAGLGVWERCGRPLPIVGRRRTAGASAAPAEPAAPGGAG